MHITISCMTGNKAATRQGTQAVSGPYMLCKPIAHPLLCRSLNQLRKELAHKLAAKAEQEVKPIPAGLDQEQSDCEMSPACSVPRATLSPRVSRIV